MLTPDQQAIKPGTASRLGLRKPPVPLLGIVRVPPLTDEQFAEFRARFEAAAGVAGHWTVLHEKTFAAASPKVESRRERRRRLGLHWWQRETR